MAGFSLQHFGAASRGHGANARPPCQGHEQQHQRPGRSGPSVSPSRSSTKPIVPAAVEDQGREKDATRGQWAFFGLSISPPARPAPESTPSGRAGIRWLQMEPFDQPEGVRLPMLAGSNGG